MKRISLILLMGLIFNTVLMAQVQGFSQRGRATQELRADGMAIAHPSLPLQSRVMVENTQTGRTVEATVTGRVAAATNRIADVSTGVWQDLDLSPNTDIRIFTIPAARARPPAPPPMEPVQEFFAEEEPLPEFEPMEEFAYEPYPGPNGEPQPTNITLHAYLVNPEPAPQPPPPQPQQPPMPTRAEPANPELNWLAWLSYMTAESRGRDMLMLPFSQQAQAQPQIHIHNQPPAPPQIIQPQMHQNVHPQFIQPQPPQQVFVQPQPQVQFVQPQPQVQFVQPPVQPPVQVQPAPIQVQVQPTPVQVQHPTNQEPVLVQVEPHPIQVQVQPPAIQVQQAPAPVEMVVQAPPVQVQVQPSQVQVLEPPPPPPPPPPPEPVPPTEVHRGPPPVAAQVLITPGLPDPNNGRIYKLQVGSFTSLNAADNIAEILRSVGFIVDLEESGINHRVLVTHIPSDLVYAASQRLGSLGIRQIWVRE